MNYLTHLECAYCGKTYEADALWNLCTDCNKPLVARYDLDAAREGIDREELGERESTLWRYREVLPVREARNRLTLGEGCTPLIHARRLGESLG